MYLYYDYICISVKGNISIIYTTTKLICVNRGKHRKTLVEYYFNGIFNAIKRYFCM